MQYVARRNFKATLHPWRSDPTEQEGADEPSESVEVVRDKAESPTLHEYPSQSFAAVGLYIIGSTSLRLLQSAEISWAREHLDQILEHDVRFFHVPSEGLRITFTREKSIVAYRGLRVGDVLQKVNDLPVSSVDDVKAALAKTPETGLLRLLVRTVLGVRTFEFRHAGWKPKQEGPSRKPVRRVVRNEPKRLSNAAWEGDVEAVKSYLESGGSPDLRAYRNGPTLLMMAAGGGQPEIVKLLIAREANVTTHVDKSSALSLATKEKGNGEVVRLLLEAGANPGGVDKKGQPLLIVAVRNGSTEIVRLLLGAGADPKVATAQGSTALMVAAMSDNLEVVRLLMKESADPAYVSGSGISALSVAAGSWKKSLPVFNALRYRPRPV